jgi:hypothetical protein
VVHQSRFEEEPIALCVVPAYRRDFGDTPMPADARDVYDKVNGQSNGLARAAVRQSDVGGQNTVRQAGEGLLRGVRVDGAEAAQVTGVQRLQKVECLQAPDLANENAIGPVSEGRAEQVGNRDGRQRCFLAKRRLCTPRFEPKHVWFV